MAKQRSVSTKFWHDPWIQDLSIDQKLLYLYLITNEHLDLCGIYEISIRTISFECGLDNKSVSKALEAFQKSGKIFYHEGWISIKNFQKNQKVNPNIKLGIERSLSLIPAKTLKAFESLSNHSTLNLTLPNSTLLNSTSPSGAKKVEQKTPAKIAENFFIKKDLQEKASKYYSENSEMELKATQQEINKFVSYWTEPNKSGTKMRWEMEKTFELSRRLTTWFSRSKQFSGFRDSKTEKIDNIYKNVKL